MNEFEIDSYIEKLASNKNVKSFYPIAICKMLKFPIKLVINRLNKLVNMGYLKLKFEIRCDNFDIMDIVDSYEDYLGKNIECEDCDSVTEFVIGLENIFPIYYINDNYREYIKKKNVCLQVQEKLNCNQISTGNYDSTLNTPTSLKDIILENTSVSSDSIEEANNKIKKKGIVDKAKNVQVVLTLVNTIHQSWEWLEPYIQPLVHHISDFIK
ncbi:hypothetical protein GTH52_06910 [Clostridium tyrobutyricum]|uniref:Uncharacterized protein n=1 Tax=Clostridium tyrobutyricum DIVETGP TaxID=1408889 RepID=W6NH63_CLOTY|nr:hypothetical protein [Clostridium tyrobutyricum]AND84303.1 hypothetical protein CTK_C10420 [Clostridium tyrobutyricum]AND84387.1 hypothetical protein CTK_C11260 [Clostridium tyrobutyricum]ANP69014.1 hypothetical protein BA182_04795 [Clostridium tyrobutyricum]MBV4435380.1 hypothetical protein [Clostridium tyrobutyricum]QNB66636.1 hypothetical protein GTH52_06910 [Clostridium tyrobutyricum]